MLPNQKQNIRLGTSAAVSQPPMNFYVKAVDRMRASDPSVEAVFGRDGRIRTLTGSNLDGLFTLPGLTAPAFTGDHLGHAKRFLGDTNIKTKLGLQNVTLKDGKVDKFNFGGVALNRVEMAQTVTLKDGNTLRVRGGYVHVALDNTGKVRNVNNTVKYGRKPDGIDGIKTAEQAVEICKTKLGITEAKSRTELVLSEEKGRLGLVYEVVLSAPGVAMFYLVLAKTGEIVHEYSMIRTSVSSKTQQAAIDRVGVRTFLRIPDPKTPIAKQVVDHFVEGLPDKTVLKNQRFTVLVKEGGKWVEVKAQADGTFNFDPVKESSKFSAVVFMVACNEQYAFYESLGMKVQTRPIKVFIDDPDVTDNAYFDPENYEIHMGIGSGVKSGGLDTHITWDLGVEWHENGHHVVYLQTPGNDLPGSEGGAMHESTGDVLGQLVMEYLWGVRYAVQTGVTLTLDMIKNDARIIGRYALPPNGIRIQRNKKKTPKDKTGEVHDDGLISGGAHADLLEAVVVKAVADGRTILDGVTDFTRLYLAALALVPGHTVRFTDMLRAMKTADTQVFAGKYAAVIDKAHADHGIVISGKATGGSTGDTTGTDTTGSGTDSESKGKGKGKGKKRNPRRRR